MLAYFFVFFFRELKEAYCNISCLNMSRLVKTCFLWPYQNMHSFFFQVGGGRWFKDNAALLPAYPHCLSICQSVCDNFSELWFTNTAAQYCFRMSALSTKKILRSLIMMDNKRLFYYNFENWNFVFYIFRCFHPVSPLSCSFKTVK